MFGKVQQGVEPSSPMPSPLPSSFREVTPPSPRPVSASSKTVIGSGSRVVGDLISDEDVMLDGQVEGKVRAERSVTVGTGGELDGDVHAKSVVISGKIKGQIFASERAELTATAVVHGSVQAPKIIIAEGAHLQGNVAMSAGSEAPVHVPVPRRESEES
ncbi:MAG TPA: polymer-forming cytoskeletal protein [Thermoanaerobaculia bacterium]|nr:polymer-forming cytoskeletal protein [Thermoanaerobaculia bacterium]